ncbi:MAG: hypothetical protein JKY48_00630, partial [Flavobacteriales bacterium]|nr:hypothetical protein [Flavobacteriales bacterium]
TIALLSLNFQSYAQCTALTPPYNQDFTSYPPTCWVEAKGQLTANTTFTSTSSNWIADGFLNSGSTGAARVNIFSTNKFEWLISPSIDLGTRPNMYRLEFDAGLTDFSGAGTDLMGADDTLSVVISTDNGTTWSSANVVKLFDVNSPPSNTGETVFIDLSTYTGIIKVGFYATSTASNTDYNVYIDNFQVRTPPACPIPTANTTSPMATNATLSWVENGTATQWEVEWDTAGYILGSGNSILVNTDTFTTLIPLVAQSTYDWYVRSICGPGDTSLWTRSNSFTTPCAPLVAPFTESFDNTSLPSCWNKFQAAGSG